MVTLTIQGSIFLATWILANVLYRYNVSASPFLVGFLVVLVLPSTISSCIVYARVAGGNTEFALGHSFLSNFIAPFLFPLSCVGWLYGVGFTGVSFLSVVERIYPRLGLLILLPLILGYLSQKNSTGASAERLGKEGTSGMHYLSFLCRFCFGIFPRFA